jgi:hypothetical protein
MNPGTATFLWAVNTLSVATGARFFEPLDIDATPTVPDPLLQWNTAAPVNALKANSANNVVRMFTVPTTERFDYGDQALGEISLDGRLTEALEIDP